MGYIVIERGSDEPHMRWFASSDCVAKHFGYADLKAVQFIDDGISVPSIMEWPEDTALVFKGEFVVPKPRYVQDGVDVK